MYNFWSWNMVCYFCYFPHLHSQRLCNAKSYWLETWAVIFSGLHWLILAAVFLLSVMSLQGLRPQSYIADHLSSPSSCCFEPHRLGTFSSCIRNFLPSLSQETWQGLNKKIQIRSLHIPLQNSLRGDLVSHVQTLNVKDSPCRYGRN